MQIHKFRAALLMSALLLQSVFLSAVPQTVSAEPVSVTEPRLVISTVQITGGTGKTHEDFIELYNPTSEPFDLNGYRLVKRTALGTTDTTIQAWSSPKVVMPNHFFLWANSNFTAITAEPDAVSSGTLADNNGIALRYGANDSGDLIESIAWGDTANGFQSVSTINPSASESLVRDELSEQALTFTLHPSNPRNSTYEFPVEEEEDPEEDPEDEPDPEVIQVNINITEILPNPSGSDSGFEQVEIYNAGNETVELSGLRLDDVIITGPISSNAYALTSAELAPDSYYVITIPSGKFSMNNTGGDIVTLFDANGQYLSTVMYAATALEGQSYSYFNDTDEWGWTEPTLGEENNEQSLDEEEYEEEVDEEQDYDNSGLEISEIYPNPATNTSEFVEIYNAGEETAQLSEVSIELGERNKKLPEHELDSGEYYIVEQASLPLQLRNSGQIVSLLEDEEILSTVTYSFANEGMSYAKLEDGFEWTTQVTEGEDNILKLPEITKKETVKTTVTKKPKTSKPKVTAPKKVTAKPPVVVAQKTNTTPVTDENLTPPEEVQISESKTPEPLGKIIAMGAAAVVAGVIALYKLVFAGGPE